MLGLLVVRVVGRNARAAEQADRGTNAAQALGRDGKLCHNAQNTPRFLSVGREIRLRIDQLGNLARLIHAYAVPRRRLVVSVPGVSRLAGSAHLARRAHGRDSRCHFHVAPIGRGRQAGPVRGRIRRTRQDVSRRLVSAIQGQPPGDARRSRAADRAAARADSRVRLAVADDRRRRSRRRHRHAGASRGNGGFRRGDLDRRQGSGPADHAARDAGQHDEQREARYAKRRCQVRRARRSDSRPADAHRRCRRQRSRRGQSRPEDRGQVAGRIRDVGPGDRARRRYRRRRRRESARCARLAAAGQEAADGQDRLHVAGCTDRAGRAAGRCRQTEKSAGALRVQDLAQGPGRRAPRCSRAHRGCKDRGAGAEPSRRRPHPRARRCRDITKPCWTCPRSSA